MGDGSARLVVSVHDVSPATADATAQWCADADSVGIPVSLLVIPGPWRGTSLTFEPEYAAILQERAAAGDEIVLHGWEHAAGPEGSPVRRTVAKAVARGAAEFAALNRQEAGDRIAAAQRVMTALNLPAPGFTPPGWLASPDAEFALARAGFGYTTNHFGVKDLRSGRLHRGFALSHRPGGGWSERFGAAMLERIAARGAARGSLVRIALHPDDLLRPGLRETTLRSIEKVLAAGARPMTYSQVVAAN